MDVPYGCVALLTDKIYNILYIIRAGATFPQIGCSPSRPRALLLPAFPRSSLRSPPCPGPGRGRSSRVGVFVMVGLARRAGRGRMVGACSRCTPRPSVALFRVLGSFVPDSPACSRFAPSGRGSFALCAPAPLPCPPFHLYMHAYTFLYAHALRHFRL